MKVRWIVYLVWLEPLWIALLGIPITFPGRFIPLHFQPFVVVGLFVFWPLRWLAYGQLSRRSPLTWALALLLLGLPLNLLASTDWRISWVAAGYLIYGLTLYFATINWPPAQRKPELAAWLLLLIGGGLAIIAPPLTGWKSQSCLFDLPIYASLQAMPIDLGETIHANILAGALAIVLPLFVSLTIQIHPIQTAAKPHKARAIASRMFYGAMAVVVGGVVVLCQSRASYLAMAIALPTIFLLRWPRLLYGVPALIIVAFFTANWAGQGVVLEQVSADGTLGGWAGRIDIWIQSVKALHDFALTGIGIGTFTLVIPLLYPLVVNIESYPHAHNIFLQIGVDLGLPGLIAYIALLLNLFVMLVSCLEIFRLSSDIKVQFDNSNALYWTLAVGAVGGMLTMIVHGLLDIVVWGTKLAFIPWVLFALITLLFDRAQVERHSPSDIESTPRK